MSFVTFEGIDASGKTTQINLLKKEFAKNKNIIFTANPGDTKLGKELRKILLHKMDMKLSEMNEMFLFFAGIYDNYEKIVLPALSRKQVVLCDRYYDSTIAYQGFGRKLNMDKILKLVEVSTLPEPDLTFLFRIDFDEFVQRSDKKGKKDKIENSKEQFYKNVIYGYDELAKIYKNRYVVLEGSCSIDSLKSQLQSILKDRMNIC